MGELDEAMARMQAADRAAAAWRQSPVTQNDPAIVTPTTGLDLIRDFITRVAVWDEIPTAAGPDGVERICNPYSQWQTPPRTENGIFRKRRIPGVRRPEVNVRGGVHVYSHTGGYDGHTEWSFYVFADGRVAGGSAIDRVPADPTIPFANWLLQRSSS